MLKNILRTAVLGIALLSGTTALAAVDTSLLTTTDLDAFDMGMKVVSVTEDTENYTVTYTYDTLEVADARWQQVSKTATMKVSKTGLGTEDLGLYAAKQMDQVVTQEKEYLKTVQAAEQQGNETESTASATYAGIVGQSLDSEEKTFEGYQPVKPTAAAETTETVLGVTSSDSSETNVVSSSPAFDALASRVDSLDERMQSFTEESGLSSKITLLEERLQALTDLVNTLTQFYMTFNLDSFLGKDGA